MGGRSVTFRTLLIIKNIILYNACSTFLCWQKKNCRVASSSGGATLSRHDNLWRQPNLRPLRAFVRQRLHPPLAHAAPRLLLHVDTTTVAPRRLRVLQQRILHPTHPRVALRTLSATAAMDLAICSGIAQAKGHTLQPTTGMLVLLLMKMNILLVLIMQGLVMITTTRMRKIGSNPLSSGIRAVRSR